MLGRFTFLISVLLLTTLPALGTERVALVIGNGAYMTVPALPNPTRDAADVARALERLDFKVTQVTNGTAVDMRKAIVEFGRAAEGSMMAVVFYAGHGMEAGGENWLIPTDAELRSDTDVESEAVSLRSVNLQVSKARQLGLIILDACRNNPFEAKMRRSLASRAVARGLAPTEPTDNVLIAYAARDGTTASDGDGRNSPFTTALLRHIETPGLEISFLFRRVRDDVMTATKREQQPFVYGSLSKEEIYLKGPTASPPNAPASGVPASPVVPTPLEPKPNTDNSTQKQAPTASAVITDRGAFSPEDGQRVTAIATKQQLKMPEFTITPSKSDSAGANSKFVGVWSSKKGWGDGKGRHAMLIITDVSATGLATGFYLWGPPTKSSWVKTPAGYSRFAEYIDKDAFSMKYRETITVKFDAKNVISLSNSNPDHPTEQPTIDLYPVWQLVKPTLAVSSPSNTKEHPQKPKELSTNSPSPMVRREDQSRSAKQAQQPSGDARCDRMHDRLGCLCALQNGGGISPDGKSWWSKRRTTDAPNEAFVRCQIRAGRT
ncbi:caspase family protein [Bradyrhizobium sp. CCBAU 51627]|uniref:caspase family protein n=1 Tax=Bradyrhizobium sp. CCBAU 51627 TaxID=1325088 RepID=UPI0023065231|nr:caspase family protein [Bradyrhizobium sp. CCBAU 51627]